MKHTLILPAVLLLAPLAASAAEPTPQTRQITNGTITVTVSTRNAGAVCSLVYDGQEFVNDHDHGRQLQAAWFYDDHGEAYNPTEAGSDSDGGGPTSTSRLLALNVTGNTLQTQSHPAFWRNLSVPERHRKNTVDVTKDKLTKKLTLGYGGDPHVLVFDSMVAISADLTGPGMESIRMEAPTLYSHAGLNRHFLLDLASGDLSEHALRAHMKNQMNEVIRNVKRHDLIPILGTADGRHAIALFTPRRPDFWAYYTHHVPSDNPSHACGKMTAFFKHAAAPGQSHAYRTFVIVGDLDTVKASARRLHARTS